MPTLGNNDGFRWRSHEISRIEGLSDAVFAFAITLLVVSLEVPKTFGELLETMRGFFAFAISFAMLFHIWYLQYTFFRRYGLSDTITATLNGILLFVVLFYVYPLKFLFGYVIGALLNGTVDVKAHDGTTQSILRNADGPLLMIIYGAGFVAVFLLFTLLYVYAWRKRGELELTPLEALITRSSIQANLVNVVVGLLSVAVAAIGGPGYSAWAGNLYFLIGAGQMINGTVMGRRQRQLAA